jgi:hypothetical protein
MGVASFEIFASEWWSVPFFRELTLRQTFRKKGSVSILEGLEFNKSDSVLNQPLVTTAQNRGYHNVAGGPREARDSGLSKTMFWWLTCM